MIFLSFLTKVTRDYPFMMAGVSILMAITAMTEGLIIALVAPLLYIALGGETSQAQEGFIADATVIIKRLLNSFGFEVSVGLILTIIVVTFFVQGFTRFLQYHLQWKMIKEYERSLTHGLLKDYLNASWLFFVNSKIGHLINVLTVETNRAASALQLALQSLAHCFLIFFYIIISSLISWKITLLAIIFGLVASAFLKWLIGRMERYGIGTSRVNNEFQSLAFDFLSSAKMLKSSATEKRAFNAVDEVNVKKTHLGYASRIHGSLIPSFYLPLVMGMLALLVYIALGYWQTNFATIIIFLYIFFRLIPALSGFHSDYEHALIYIPAADEIARVRIRATRYIEKSGKKLFTHLKKTIDFRHIVFGYKHKENFLNDVTIRVKRGESIAIVGPSGAGKTSLVDILLGLLTPVKGIVLIDNVPLNMYTVTSWRKKIGYLSQDVFLFHDTLRTNLTWMAPRASEQEIRQAIKAAYADEFIKKMPKGLDTLIGDRGVKLSGGQRQRIALARLLLQNPDIVIFDEAMSALDSHSEKMIQKAIANHLKEKTKIIISHRLSSVKHADRIYVLEKGRIGEEGTWDELMNKKGVLAHLHYQQET